MKDWIEIRDFDGNEQVDFHEFLKFSTLLLQQDNTEREEPLSIESPKPPDGGWGWIVVFACFMCNAIVGNFLFISVDAFSKISSFNLRIFLFNLV